MSSGVEMIDTTGSGTGPGPGAGAGTTEPGNNTMWGRAKAKYDLLRARSVAKYESLKEQYTRSEPAKKSGSDTKKETTFDKLGRKWNSNSTKQKWILGIFFVLLFFAIIVALCYWASKICSGDASTQGVLCKLANDVAGAASDLVLYPYIFIGILILGMLMKAFAFIRNNAKDKLTKKQTPEEEKADKNEREKNPTTKERIERKTVDGVVNIPATFAEYMTKGFANLAKGTAFDNDNKYDPNSTPGDEKPGSDPDPGHGE